MVAKDSRVSSLASVLRGAGFFLVGRVAANLLGFISNAILTQGLGPAGFGIYSLARTMIQTTASVSNLGADKAVLRFVSEDDEHQDAQLSFSYLVGIVGGGGAGIVLIIAAPVISTYFLDNAQFITALRLFGALLLINPFITISVNGFRALDRPDLSTFLQQVMKPLSLVIAVGFAFLLFRSVVGFIIAAIVAAIATAVVGISLISQRVSLQWSLPPEEIDIKSYLRYSLPLAFKDAGSVLYTRSDILIVGLLLSASSVGYYQIAILLSSILVIPLSAIAQIFPPIISRLYSNDEREEMVQVYKTATRWTVTGMLPLGTGLLIFRNEILQFFGEEFTAASVVLIFFTGGQLANALAGPSGYVLMMTDHQFILTANQWVFGGANILLNIILIQSFGLPGAAIATAGILTLINIARLVEVFYFERVHPFSIRLVKPLVAASIMGMIVLAIRWMLPPIYSLITGVVSGGCIYFGSLLLLGIEPVDKELITDWKN